VFHKTDLEIFKNATALRHKLTDAENCLWNELRIHQMKGAYLRCQHAIGHYIVDFCAPSKKLIIELDGGQHLEQEDYDRISTTCLQNRGYRVVRFWDDEELTDLETVLQVIYDVIE
jgi:very-short-patch-repair endonuclease